MNPKLRNTLSVGAASLILTSVTLAQSPRKAEIDVDRIVREAHGVHRVDGDLLAKGGAVEAAFEAGRVQVTPMLGSAAPHNMPLTLRLQSILRGGETKAIVDTDTQPTSRTLQVEYQHQNGITERYVARPDGIKQSILLEQPVAGSGDLIVRLSLDSELVCPITTEARQLSFEAGELGGVHFGTVVGIDADGLQAEGTMSWNGDHLDLVLPADFVDGARYPLDVDPIISGIINTGRSFNDSEPDVAYDLTNDVYFVVYQTNSSSTDRDVYGQFLSGAGVRLGAETFIATNNHLSQSPKVGNCNIENNFFVAWQDNGSGNWDIKGASVDAATGTVSAIMDVAATAADEVSPDVGGDSYFATNFPGQCMCVWDDTQAGIKSCVVQMNVSPPTTSNETVLVNGPDPFRNEPAITKDGRNAGRYFVAYRHDPQFLSVIGVDYFGNVVGVPTTAAFSANDAVGNPDIDGDGANWTLVYERKEPGSTTLNDIYAAHGIWDGTNIVTQSGGPLDAQPNFDERQPCISLMGSKYTAAWITPRPGGTEVRMTNLDLDSVDRCGTEHVITGSGEAMTFPAIVSRRSSGDTESEEGLVSYRRFLISTTQALLDSRLYATFQSGPINPLPGAGGCGLGGNVGISSPFAIGNSAFSITLSGADPTSTLALQVIDLTLTPPFPVCGPGCQGAINPFLTSLQPVAGGASDRPLPLPCDPNLVGLRMFAQWSVISSSPGGCALLPLFHLSDAIDLTMGN